MWTSENIQLAVILLEVGKEIGLEKRNMEDQFIRVEQGNARVVI